MTSWTLTIRFRVLQIVLVMEALRRDVDVWGGRREKRQECEFCMESASPVLLSACSDCLAPIQECTHTMTRFHVCLYDEKRCVS